MSMLVLCLPVFLFLFEEYNSAGGGCARMPRLDAGLMDGQSPADADGAKGSQLVCLVELTKKNRLINFFIHSACKI